MTVLKQSALFVVTLLLFSGSAAALSGKDYLIYSPNITDDESSPVALDVSLFFVLHGDELVWENIWSKKNTAIGDLRDTLFLMNISTNTTTEIYHVPRTGDPYFIAPPLSVSDNFIAWSEDGDNNIFLYTLSGQDVHQVTTDGTAPDARDMWINANPVVDGDRLVWAKKNPWGTNNYTLAIENLTTGTFTTISIAPGDQDQANPSISGNLITWSDRRNQSDDGDIYLFDLNTSRETPVCAGPGGHKYPKISRTTLVWRDYRDGTPSVYLYNLTTHTESRISDPQSIAGEPYVSGNFVVWQESSVFDTRDERASWISVYSLATGAREILPVSTDFPQLFGFDNNRILYANPDDKSLEEGYVHVYVIDTPVPVIVPAGENATTNESDQGVVVGMIPVEETPVRQSPVPMSLILMAAACGILVYRKKMYR